VRLEVTRRSELAVRALRVLARSRALMKSAELARELGSTAGFVPQAMAPLVHAGWVRSEPGPTGGYLLDTDLSRVSVLDVIEAIEGPTDSGQCVLAKRPCTETGPCALHAAWTTARAELLSQLGRVSVADASLFAIESSVRAPRRQP
jgi:Rrf2 family protein